MKNKRFKKTRTKFLSAINRGVNFYRDLDIKLCQPPEISPKKPPWKLNRYTINMELSNLNTQNTNAIIFSKNFKFIKNQFSNHTFIYTDGSKTQNSTSFSITTEEQTLKIGVGAQMLK